MKFHGVTLGLILPLWLCVAAVGAPRPQEEKKPDDKKQEQPAARPQEQPKPQAQPRPQEQPRNQGQPQTQSQPRPQSQPRQQPTAQPRQENRPQPQAQPRANEQPRTQPQPTPKRSRARSSRRVRRNSPSRTKTARLPIPQPADRSRRSLRSRTRIAAAEGGVIPPPADRSRGSLRSRTRIAAAEEGVIPPPAVRSRTRNSRRAAMPRPGASRKPRNAPSFSSGARAIGVPTIATGGRAAATSAFECRRRVSGSTSAARITSTCGACPWCTSAAILSFSIRDTGSSFSILCRRTGRRTGIRPTRCTSTGIPSTADIICMTPATPTSVWPSKSPGKPVQRDNAIVRKFGPAMLENSLSPGWQKLTIHKIEG